MDLGERGLNQEMATPRDPERSLRRAVRADQFAAVSLPSSVTFAVRPGWIWPLR